LAVVGEFPLFIFILYKMLIGHAVLLWWGAALLFNGCEAATPNEATAKRTDQRIPYSISRTRGGGPPRVFAEWPSFLTHSIVPADTPE